MQTLVPEFLAPAQGRTRPILRGFGLLTAAIALYLVVSNVLHRQIFPLPAPDPATWPQVGDVLRSDMEGFTQRIHAIEDGWIVSELIIEPGAEGPPLHYHREFAEEFTVVSGTLHVELADGVIQVPAGESFTVEPGVVHRPFNPTALPVVVGAGKRAIPLTFAACLVQLYSLMEETGNGPAMIPHIAVIDPICDTHLAALPPGGEWLLRTALGPAARLAGYRNYYPERALHAPPSEA